MATNVRFFKIKHFDNYETDFKDKSISDIVGSNNFYEEAFYLNSNDGSLYLGNQKLSNAQEVQQLIENFEQLYDFQREITTTNTDGTVTTETIDYSDIDKGKAIRTIAIEELSYQLLSDKAEADFKTLQELGAWIEDHPESVAEMNLAIQNNAKDIDDIQLDIMRLDVQPDWNLENDQSHAYIKNKPPIKWYKGDVYVGGTSLDDGKRLATENYVNEQNPIFIATYGETTYEEVKEAYEANKEVILIILNANDTDGKTIIARLVEAYKVGEEEYSFIFEGTGNGVFHYAGISGIKPFVGWGYWNIDYMKEINTKRETFIATYGETTYEEVAKAYYSGKQLYLNINKDDKNLELTNKATNCIASLLRVDGTDRDKSVFAFVCDENGISHHYSINYYTKKWSNWHVKWKSTIDDLSNDLSIAQSDINRLSTLLTSSLNSFRGGFRNTRGVLHINAPGIYLVLQGGSGKTMIITQNGTQVYQSPSCSGWIVLSSDDGIITPIGIKSGIEALAGSFETPGTYQGWIKGQKTHTTIITYPANCVIWYLGNSTNYVGTWS